MEEHGIGRTDADVALGERVRVYPYHSCTCLNMTDELFGVRGDRIEVVWPVRARGLRA